MKTITYEEFAQVELRSGTVIEVKPFERARKPAYQVTVDFGPTIGIKKTSAQITIHYTPETLLGRHIIGCINLAPKNIAGFMSEFLLVGFPDAEGAICLASVDGAVPNGQKLC
jgi:tRNA-binding protein